MARSVFKPSLLVPIAHYFSLNLKGITTNILDSYSYTANDFTCMHNVILNCFVNEIPGERIFPLVWEAIEALELYKIPVVSLTSDGAKSNRRFYRMCQKRKTDLPLNPSTRTEMVMDCTSSVMCHTS